MTVPDRTAAWRKSSFSSQEGDCVEVHHELCVMRDSKNPGVELTVPQSAFATLLRALGR